MSQLKQLLQQQTALLEALSAVNTLIQTENERIAEVSYGVRIGSIVSNDRGEEYQVTEIGNTCNGKPWIKGHP